MSSLFAEVSPRWRIRNWLGVMAVVIIFGLMLGAWSHLGYLAPWYKNFLVALVASALIVLVMFGTFREHMEYWFRKLGDL